MVARPGSGSRSRFACGLAHSVLLQIVAATVQALYKLNNNTESFKKAQAKAAAGDEDARKKLIKLDNEKVLCGSAFALKLRSCCPGVQVELIVELVKNFADFPLPWTQVTSRVSLCSFLKNRVCSLRAAAQVPRAQRWRGRSAGNCVERRRLLGRVAFLGQIKCTRSQSNPACALRLADADTDGVCARCSSVSSPSPCCFLRASVVERRAICLFCDYCASRPSSSSRFKFSSLTT